MRVNISLDDDLLKELDDYCKRFHDDRSGIVSEAIRNLLYFRLKEDTHTLHTEYGGAIGKIPEGVKTATEMDLPSMGYCKLHWSEKVHVTRVTWEDESGNPVIDQQLICDKCLEKYKKIGRGRLYYL